MSCLIEKIRRKAAVSFVLISAAALLCGCVIERARPVRSQLEIRQMQSRSYDAPAGGIKKIMKAVINVLQDDGYIIKNADKELGFITASKETDIKDQWEAFFAQFADGASARYRTNSVLESSVNISEFGREIRVRAVFQIKILDNFGATVTVKQVDQPTFYQDFFIKVDKGVFLERQDL